MSHPRTRSMFAKAKASVTGSPADILDAILADQVAVARARAEHPEPNPIVTSHVYPPIPDRSFDWNARRDNSEPDDDGHMEQGWGHTEAEAIADLLRLEAELADEYGGGDAPDDYPLTERQQITAAKFEEYETDRMWGREDE